MPRLRGRRHTLVAIGLLPIAAMVPTQTLATQAAALENGKETFEEYCAACHGFDGIKQVPKAPSFAVGERLEKPDYELIKMIKEGKGNEMPPWEEDLSEPEIMNVLSYIRTLNVKRDK